MHNQLARSSLSWCMFTTDLLWLESHCILMRCINIHVCYSFNNSSRLWCQGKISFYEIENVLFLWVVFIKICLTVFFNHNLWKVENLQPYNSKLLLFFIMGNVHKMKKNAFTTFLPAITYLLLNKKLGYTFIKNIFVEL